MAAYPTGLGNDQQAQQATAAMRQEPWYQSLLQSWGIDPNDVDQNGNPRTKLSDDQRTKLMQTAIERGIGFNNKYDGIDENGQIIEEHHKLRNGLIAAAIGGAAATGLGAAGIGPLSGLFGATTAAIPATEGIASATSLGLPVTAGLGTAGTVAGAAGTAGAVGGALKGASSLSKIGSLLGAAGKGVGDATTAAGQNDLNQEKLGLDAATIDINGQHTNIADQIAVGKENTSRNTRHLKDQYLLEKASHPSVSPFNITGGPKVSPEYLSSLQQLAAQNPELLKAPAPYKPITPSGAQAATGTTPSTMQKIGNILSPALTVAPKLAAMF